MLRWLLTNRISPGCSCRIEPKLGHFEKNVVAESSDTPILVRTTPLSHIVNMNIKPDYYRAQGGGHGFGGRTPMPSRRLPEDRGVG